jgi:rubredoxin
VVIVLNSIISVLVAYNQFLISQIQHLLVFIAKNIPLRSPKCDVTSPKYNKLTVVKLPIIKKLEPLNYILLLEEYKAKHGKNLKPVNPRGKNPVPSDCICPRCGAPHTYIYGNTGGRGQLLCKVCNHRFSKGKTDFKPIALLCPYCGHTLAPTYFYFSFIIIQMGICTD